MSKFILSGFADEIDTSLDAQIAGLTKLGIANIEVRGVDGRNISTYTAKEAEAIRAKLDAAKITVSALGSPIGKIGLDVAEDFEKHFETFKTMLDVADVLGTRYMRMFSFFIPKGDKPAQHRDEVMRRLERMVNASVGRKVMMAHENEGGIYGEQLEDCEDIMKTFGGAIRCVFDPGNFVIAGVKPREAYPVLRPYLEYLHIKDARTNRARRESEERDMGFQNVSSEILPAGKGDADIEWVMDALWKDGFSGFISLEPHLVNNNDYPGDGLAKFTAAAEHLNAIIQRVTK